MGIGASCAELTHALCPVLVFFVEVIEFCDLQTSVGGLFELSPRIELVMWWQPD